MTNGKDGAFGEPAPNYSKALQIAIGGRDGSCNSTSHGMTYGKPGLTKREYFAAMAMQGLCANSIPGRHHTFGQLTQEAVLYADALIKELNKEL